MANEDGASYAFTYGGVHEAPHASGLYTIYSPQGWVHAGESDDIRQRLYELLNESSPWTDRFGPLSFSFELMTPAERVARQASLGASLPAS